MLLFNIMDWIFYNPYVFVGSICLLFAVISKIISRSSSVSVGNYGKARISRSKVVRRRSAISTYSLLILGIVLLLIGFWDKFDYGKTSASGAISRTKLLKEFKKCTPFREGYCLCRTYDHQSTWILIRQSDGMRSEKIKFPDALEVIGIDLFQDGKAPVIGVPEGHKEKVAEVDTLGQVYFFRKG